VISSLDCEKEFVGFKKMLNEEKMLFMRVERFERIKHFFSVEKSDNFLFSRIFV
jgi:hypothetical protein